MLRSGNYFDLQDPSASRFEVTDIAHALSNICRFTGHTRQFYSVAEHSVLCSYLVPHEDRWEGTEDGEGLPDGQYLRCCTPAVAMSAFMARFYELGGKK